MYDIVLTLFGFSSAIKVLYISKTLFDHSSTTKYSTANLVSVTGLCHPDRGGGFGPWLNCLVGIYVAMVEVTPCPLESKKELRDLLHHVRS